MATRACVKLLLSTVVRRERTCLISSLTKLPTHSCVQLSKYVPILNANYGFARNYCTIHEELDGSNFYKCRLRGLPWAATEENVKVFLGDVVAKSIQFQYDRSGRFSGVVHVALETEEDLDATLSKHGEYIGHRHIDVSKLQMNTRPRFDDSRDTDKIQLDAEDAEEAEDFGFIVKCRGVPFRVSTGDIEEFFGDINVKRVDYIYNRRGLFSGSVLVELNSQDDVEEAMRKHGEYIADRHIDVLPSDVSNRNQLALKKFSSIVKVHNLPYSCTREEIKELFTGLTIEPDGIQIPLNREMMPIGLALVRFTSPEMADSAVQRSSQLIGNREVYVHKWTMATQKGPLSSRRGGQGRSQDGE